MTNCLSHGMAQQNDRLKGRKILCVQITQFYALCDIMMEHMEQNICLTYINIMMMQVEKYKYNTPIVNSEVRYQQQLIIMPTGSRNFQVPNVPSSTATKKWTCSCTCTTPKEEQTYWQQQQPSGDT